MKILLLDGGYSHTMAVAQELKTELNATIIGVGLSPKDVLLRSRYCDISTLAPTAASQDYSRHILSLSEEHKPDLVFPVGFHSHAAVLEIRDALPPLTKTTAWVSDWAFKIASDKALTYQLAESLGIQVPADLTRSYKAAIDNHEYDKLKYPFFLKARHEAGGITTALVSTANQLRLHYPRMTEDFEAVLIQEYIDSGPDTYAHCGLFEKGKSVLSMQHHELRSVPRHGGSGTRVRTVSDATLERASETLLEALGWNGIAQVEFKRRANGDLVLMEINPKLWASYSLAYRAGYPMASIAALKSLSMTTSQLESRAKRNMEMVFPIREARHVLKNLKSENPLQCALAMLWPPAVVDFDFRDLPAHLPMPLGSHSWRRGNK